MVLRLVGKRLLAVIPVLFLVTILGFLLIQLAPGDPARTVAGEGASPEQVELIRHQLGLDRSLIGQYGSFIRGIASLRFGTSLQDGRPVGDVIREVLPVTASLGLIALVMAVLIAVPFGTLAALHKGKPLDRVITAVAAVGLALPPFVIALILVLPLAIFHSWLPATGYVPFMDDPWQWLRHLLLPGLTLAIVSAAELVRQVRGGLIDAFEQDFIRTSRAKGVSELLVIGKHAARTAGPAVVTVFGLQVGRVIGGAVLVEYVFALPGFGQVAVSAVTTHDLLLIQGLVIVSAVLVLATNLLVDVASGYLNPRLRT